MRQLGMGAVILLLSATLSSGQQTQFLISGEYIEDRSNRVYGCYCEWSGERVTGGREAIIGWHVTDGEYRKVALGGLKMAAVIVGEATLSAGAAPRQSLVFLDAAGSPAQHEAAEALLRGKYAALLGRILSINVVPIEFQRNAERASLRIGDLVNVALRKANPPADALQGAIRWYDPFIPMTQETLGMTVNTRYQGDEFNQNWDLNETGISGFFGTFEFTAP